MTTARTAFWVGIVAAAGSVAVSAAGCHDRAEPLGPAVLTVGHVGHDHQLALYVAALDAERFRKAGAPWLKEVKDRQVYDLVDGGSVVVRLRLVKMGGGSNIPAALSRGEIDLGLGSIVAVAKFIDEGQPFKVICPLQTDGDMLVMRKDSPVTDWASFVAAAKAGPRPLRIGYKAPMAVAKAVLEGAMASEGLAFGPSVPAGGAGVVMVNFGSEKGPVPLLESGSLDGFVMNQPGPAVAVHKGVGKIVCHLRDLPPAGKWIDHPCCCVMASEKVLSARARAVAAFLKVIHLGTRAIHDDPAAAVDCAHRWTRYPLAVERASVPTVSYDSETTEAWLAGLRTWLEIARRDKLFKGRFAQANAEQFLAGMCSLELCRQAAKELRGKGLLK